MADCHAVGLVLLGSVVFGGPCWPVPKTSTFLSGISFGHIHWGALLEVARSLDNLFGCHFSPLHCRWTYIRDARVMRVLTEQLSRPFHKKMELTPSTGMLAINTERPIWLAVIHTYQFKRL